MADQHDFAYRHRKRGKQGVEYACQAPAVFRDRQTGVVAHEQWGNANLVLQQAAIGLPGNIPLIGKLPGSFVAAEAVQEDAKPSVGSRIGCAQGVSFQKQCLPAMHESHVDGQGVVATNQIVAKGAIEYADARRSPLRESVCGVFPGIHDVFLATSCTVVCFSIRENGLGCSDIYSDAIARPTYSSSGRSSPVPRSSSGSSM